MSTSLLSTLLSARITVMSDKPSSSPGSSSCYKETEHLPSNSRKRIVCSFLDFLSLKFNVQCPNSDRKNTRRVKASLNGFQRFMELSWDTGMFTIPGFAESVVNQEQSTFQILLQNYFLLTESHDVSCDF